MKASCAPISHSFVGMLSVLLMLAARCSAQMVTYDISGNGEDFTKGEFHIVCPVGSYCMLPVQPGFEIGPSWTSSHIDLDPTAYLPNSTFYWRDQREPSPASIGGKRCKGDECIITCDSGCSCRLGPGTESPGELTQDCTITETLPDASIPHPDESVAFGSASQKPDFIAIRCSGTFIRKCTTAPFSDGSYRSRGLPPSDPGYDWGMDYTDCSSADDGGVCYEACDPRCECIETKGNETMPCATGTAPPTAAPTVAPTPTSGSDGVGMSSMHVIFAASISIIAASFN